MNIIGIDFLILLGNTIIVSLPQFLQNECLNIYIISSEIKIIHRNLIPFLILFSLLYIINFWGNVSYLICVPTPAITISCDLNVSSCVFHFHFPSQAATTNFYRFLDLTLTRFVLLFSSRRRCSTFHSLVIFDDAPFASDPAA